MRGPSDRPRFSLTYDDGPESGVTDRLLEVLGARRARATFFCVGEQVCDEPEVARRLLDEGHEVGSHTMHHRDHIEVNEEEAIADMLEGVALIEEVLAVEHTLYRAPYGHFVPATIEAATKRGWKCVLWSAWGLDWGPRDTRGVASLVLRDLAPGTIVLLHDALRYTPRRVDCTATIEATAIVLEEAQRRGLECVTVGELLDLSPPG